MACYIIFNRDTPAQRLAEQFAARLGKETSMEGELVDADSPRGIQLVETYDILQRPAVLLTKEDGAPLQIWQGDGSMPAPADVAYLAHQ